MFFRKSSGFSYVPLKKVTLKKVFSLLRSLLSYSIGAITCLNKVLMKLSETTTDCDFRENGKLESHGGYTKTFRLQISVKTLFYKVSVIQIEENIMQMKACYKGRFIFWSCSRFQLHMFNTKLSSAISRFSSHGSFLHSE